MTTRHKKTIIDMWKIYQSARSMPEIESYTNVKVNWFQYYSNIDSIESMGNWVNYTNRKFPPAIYKNKTVVDMGCGWGLFSILCFLQGAKKVYAVGPDKRVDFLEEIVRKAGYTDGIIIKKLLFNVTTETIIRGCDIDIIIGNEFIEHLTFEQRKMFFKAAHSNLSDKGILLLHTHNTDNKKILQYAKIHWDKMEKKYIISKRREIITNEFSKLNEQEITKLIAGTYGMRKEEIMQIGRDYMESKVIPAPQYGLCAVDPESGIPEENCISPATVRKEMANAGFRSRIFPWFGSGHIGKLFYAHGYIVPFFLIRSFIKNITLWGQKR